MHSLQFNALSMTSTDWLFGIRVENKCVLPAFSICFQREFDKYKNAGCRV